MPNETPTAPRDDAALVPEATARERPILFSGPMVRALLDGSKTQTRRVVKPQPRGHTAWKSVISGSWFLVDEETKTRGADLARPYGRPGDRLWVRETWCYATDVLACTVGVGYHADSALRLRGDLPTTTIPDGSTVYNGHADEWPGNVKRWRPSIFMPRWASRLTLEVTDVRVERLQDISEDDARAEGVFALDDSTKQDAARSVCADGRSVVDPSDYYRTLWDSLNAKRCHGWDVNPWVWVLSFRRVSSDAPAADAAGRA